MRGFYLLLRRDLTQRTPLFVASLVMGVLIVGMSLLPHSRVSPAEVRGAAALVTVLCWCTLLAILLGGSIFTRDLFEGRLAFDFRLPVRPGAIWAARLLAAALTVALAGGLVLAMPAAIGMDFSGAAGGFEELVGNGVGVSSSSALALAPLLLLAILLAANPVSLGARSRRAWVVVDFLSLLALGGVAFWSWRQLSLWDAREALWWNGAGFIAASSIATLAASFLQIRSGRTEVDKSQKAHASALCVTSLVSLSLLVVNVLWAVHPDIGDLAGMSANASGLGSDWVFLSGSRSARSDVWSRFLLEPSEQRSVRLGPSSPYFPGGRPNRSFDGSTIAWLETESVGGRAARFHSLKTRIPDARPQASPVVTGGTVGEWALSPAGTTVAWTEYTATLRDPQRVVISELTSGAIRYSQVIPPCVYVVGEMFYFDETTVIVPCRPFSDVMENPETVLRVDFKAGSSYRVPLGSLSPVPIDGSFGLFRGNSEWLQLEKIPHGSASFEWLLGELRGGATKISISLPDRMFAYPGPQGLQLLDGRIALAGNSRDGNRLYLFSETGALEEQIPLHEGEAPRILEEVSEQGLLLVATREKLKDTGSLRTWTLAVVELASGKLEVLGDGLAILGDYRNLTNTQSVVRDRQDHLLWFDSKSRTLHPLLQDSQYRMEKSASH